MQKFLDVLLFWVWMLALIVGGGYTAYSGSRQEDLARKSRSWPYTNGKIISSYVEVRETRAKSYRPRIQYQYAFKSVTYKNDRIYFGEVSSRRDDASETLAKYPMGKTVSVYYNPEAPEISCLEPGRYQAMSGIIPAFGFVAFLIGLTISLAKFIVFAVDRATKRRE